jgi:hypothetical protein
VNLFRVFIPHILGLIGAVLWFMIVVQIAKQRTALITITSFPLYILLFLTLVGATPSRWLRAAPTEDQNAEIAVVFNFGYEMNGDRMRPGEANQYLWQWIASNKPLQLRTILVQEGVWVAADKETLKNLGIEMMRIHRHDPHIYVDTLNATFCSIQQIQKLGKKKILLIAHDLQLQRIAWDFERISHVTCPDCMFVIPEIHDVPYPKNSVHFQTRNEFIYKIAELLIARPRDFLNQIPTDCLAPINQK